jgi:TIR domain
MTKISISYRRKDSDAITGRIFDRLVAHYGAGAVFRDIDNIPPGYDFRKYISSALESTDILLAVVGPQWTGKTEGRIRIHEVTDLVRIEIEAALRKDIPVVPLLIGNATMPDPSELPDGLKDFAFRNAVKVDALEDFDDHVKRLIRNLDRLLETSAHVQEKVAPPAREPPPDIDEAPARSTLHRSNAPHPGGAKAEGGAGPSASEDIASRMRTPEREHARPDLDPTREQPSRQFHTPTSISPLLVLPGIVIIVYFILYITGIWQLGQTSLYAPAHTAAQAGLFWFCMVRYGRAGATRSLLGAAAVWCASSALSLASGSANSTMLSSIPPSDRALFVALNGVIGSLLFAAAIMAISAYLCPILNRRRYWLMALIGYPLLTLVLSSVLPAMISSSIDRSSLPAVFFAALAVRQAALFACLGLWVSQPFRAGQRDDSPPERQGDRV